MEDKNYYRILLNQEWAKPKEKNLKPIDNREARDYKKIERLQGRIRSSF